MKEKEGSAEKYIRVGTTLYKIVQRPLISGLKSTMQRYSLTGV
jgi:hypothetical protein